MAFYLVQASYTSQATAAMIKNPQDRAAAVAMAVGSSGGVSAYRTTPLLTPAEAMDAMKKAGGVGYQPPK